MLYMLLQLDRNNIYCYRKVSIWYSILLYDNPVIKTIRCNNTFKGKMHLYKYICYTKLCLLDKGRKGTQYNILLTFKQDFQFNILLNGVTYRYMTCYYIYKINLKYFFSIKTYNNNEISKLT